MSRTSGNEQRSATLQTKLTSKQSAGRSDFTEVIIGSYFNEDRADI